MTAPSRPDQTGLSISCVDAVAAIPRDEWNALVGDDHPFLRHEFLHALEASGAVAPDTGWRPGT